MTGRDPAFGNTMRAYNREWHAGRCRRIGPGLFNHAARLLLLEQALVALPKPPSVPQRMNRSFPQFSCAAGRSYRCRRSA